MFKLTNLESRIYEAMMAEPGHVWTVEQIADVIYSDRPAPKFWRHSVLSQVKSVRMKTYLLGDNRVVKISKANGRGNKGRFTLQKNAIRLGLPCD